MSTAHERGAESQNDYALRCMERLHGGNKAKAYRHSFKNNLIETFRALGTGPTKRRHMKKLKMLASERLVGHVRYFVEIPSGNYDRSPERQNKNKKHKSPPPKPYLGWTRGVRAFF